MWFCVKDRGDHILCLVFSLSISLSPPPLSSSTLPGEMSHSTEDQLSSSPKRDSRPISGIGAGLLNVISRSHKRSRSDGAINRVNIERLVKFRVSMVGLLNYYVHVCVCVHVHIFTCMYMYIVQWYQQ